MRRTLIALSWLGCPALLLAAPVPTGQTPAAAPTTQAQFQAAARDYARNIFQVIGTIEANYVRPVNRADLVEAALTGLYEAAHVPVPAGLKAAIKKSEKDGPEPVLRTAGGRLIVPVYSGGPLYDIALKTRLDLGNVEALQGRQALMVSSRAIMRTLDPFCSVVTAEEAATPTGLDQNAGVGIDLVDRSGAGPLLIKAVVPGGPAQRAGLQAGEHITHIDDKETTKLTTAEALRMLNGGSADVTAEMLRPPPPPGVPVPPEDRSGGPVPVRLTVRSAGAGERKLTLLRDNFLPETVQGVTRAEDNSWEFWLDRKKRIAQVRIVYLARDGFTAAELERVLARLDSGEGMGGLILDLRWCPGGYLASATATAELFIEQGLIAKTEIRREGDHEYTAGETALGKFLRFPIVVLVNGETSGGGELIAAAIQDHKRGVVAGQRTRGKGSIQQPFDVALYASDGRIDGELKMRLTNGTFLRANGKGLSRFADSKPTDDWGVRPDENLEFRVSADMGRQLKEWWNQQSVRPGSSSKALPLDDPEQDPQRTAALKALLRIMSEKK
jgi:carboxyl-terminal processing protease